jgi:DNA-binding transcriptional ArsR family regulator
MSEKSLMISLGDERLKQISEVIGNKTCNRILDFLGEKNATVSDISREMKIPINTADYNVKKLVEAGLIEKTSHFWSVKGKKMPVYRVSNKKIIISPKKPKSLVSFVLALGLTGFFALIIKKFTEVSNLKDGEIMLQGAETESLRGSLGFFSSMAPWEWFLIGAWFAIILFFVISILSERRASKE